MATGRLQVAALLETSSVFAASNVEFDGWWLPASEGQAPRAVLAGADGDIEVDMLELWQAGLFDSDAIEVAEFEDDWRSMAG